MRTVTYRVTDENRTICLGKVDENNATQIRFDAEDIFAEYPSAIPTLSVINPEGVVYPAIVNRDGNVVTWNVQDSDVATEGTGEIQLAFTAGSNVVRSFIYTTRINRSIVSDDVPDPVDDWLTEAGTALYTIEHMTASAEGLPAGSEPTAEYQDGNIAFGIPKGEKGDPGTDGHSPVVTAEKSGKITTVSVDGETIATINDGEDGTDGVTPNLIAGTTTTGAAGTSASVTRRAGSPDSAPIFDFTIPKGDKGDHGDLQLDSTLTSASAAAPADQVGNLKSAVNKDNKRLEKYDGEIIADWEIGTLNQNTNLTPPCIYAHGRNGICTSEGTTVHLYPGDTFSVTNFTGV